MSTEKEEIPDNAEKPPDVTDSSPNKEDQNIVGGSISSFPNERTESGYLSSYLESLKKAMSFRFPSFDTISNLSNLTKHFPKEESFSDQIYKTARSLSESNLFEQIKRYQDVASASATVFNQLSHMPAPSVDLKDFEKKIKELEKALEDFRVKERVNHLLMRIHPKAQIKLLKDRNFQSMFDDREASVAVISVDIRRSTELMLKAQSSESFAFFVTSLCLQLRDAIIQNYGIMDKFTGDGVLAFFPEFYAGEDAISYAFETANSAHRIFSDHYNTNRKLFSVVLKNVGLGIGIDYGKVQITKIYNDFTVVGRPVVYACRMGSAAIAGETLINQPAIDKLIEKHGSDLNFTEKTINTKHEGDIIAYVVHSLPSVENLAKPSWL